MPTSISRRPGRTPSLNALRVFESVARHMSFSEAAKELHITQGAVSQQIHALEDWLGNRLFERSGRRLTITAAAQQYATSVSGSLEQLAAATEDFCAAHRHHVLTIGGHTTLFVRWLIPQLPAFQAAHPDIKVRLSSSVEPVDFRVDAVDAGIQYGVGDWPGLRCDLLFNDALQPVASPTLLERSGNTTDPNALLATLPFLYSNRRPRHWHDWLAAAGVRRQETPADMVCEDLSVVYECAISGLGVALGQRRYLQRELASGQLVPAHPFILNRPAGYYLVSLRGETPNYKVDTFRQWLLDRCRLDEALPP